MKKTLFAMAALALCGTAFAATYDTSTLSSFDLRNFNKYDEAVTLNVNMTVAFERFNVNTVSNPLVLNFVGSNTFSVTGNMFYVNTNGYSATSIIGDAAAATYWETELLKTPGAAATITLASSSTEMTTLGIKDGTSFMGKSANQTLTLGNTELTYVGYKSVYDSTGMDNIKGSLGDNQIALVGVSSMPGQSGGGIFLVGKITPTVPEPATATLSLMALAGLCARRRRK